MRKILSFALALVMAVGTLAGCGASSSSSSSAAASTAASSTAADAPVTLKWAVWDIDATTYYQPLIDAYQKANPNVTIEMVDLGSTDYMTVLATQLSGGADDLDVITVKDIPGYSNLVNLGMLEPLDKLNTTDTSLYGGTIEQITVDGSYYAVPFRSDFWVVYYNKALFDAAGVDYPTNDMTLDEYDALAREMTSGEGADKVYGCHYHTWRSAVQLFGILNGENTIIYALLIATAVIMLVPFAWMISSSLKLNKDVFSFPMQWIPSAPRWRNYIDIWTKIPLLTFVTNTAKLTVIVTLLQLFTSSFAAYGFAKLRFKGRNTLFLAYVATIAVPWQAYMVPQFMMMRSFHLNNTHLAIICLQAFSAFGVFMMRQFYEGIPDELCEAARIDGLNEYQIWWRIMLPLSKPALSTLVIFTFVNTWNDFLGPMIYLTETKLKTLQIGLRMFITQYSSEYGLIMAASVLSLIPVLIVFLSLQKYFVQGVASSGLKG